ncbi:GNAT family N-acetyltransferase [Roseomonas elaeocarpi]|uniref:GNAT family N-acetyltransferase n=1 Tax=Roseomonas elaeocarpi TaxID=907779 RepID=A0ABV6JY73_9PROT
MSMTTAKLRDYVPQDAAALGNVALAAFEQFKDTYSDWPAMAAGLTRMGTLAEAGEIVVAEDDGRLVGGVAYIGPHKPKAGFFDPAWPIIRMLVVTPLARGQGLGRRLTEACIQRAERDGSPIIALHTTPIMDVALPMYLRMGFVRLRAAPDIHGVPYGLYTKALG